MVVAVSTSYVHLSPNLYSLPIFHLMPLHKRSYLVSQLIEMPQVTKDQLIVGSG